MTTDDFDSAPSHSSRQEVTRRRVLAASGGVGLTLLAGCSGQSGSDSSGSSTDGSAADEDGSSDSTASSESGDGTSGERGTFRLLVSDQPAAIDDFDSLEVSLEKARIFKSQSEDTADADASAATGTDAETETATANGTATATSTPTPTSTETATGTVTETTTGTVTETTTDTEDDSAAAESEADEETDDEDRGFTVIDLDGATVDLTRLVGEKASSVFTGELETGRYTKIELYAASVEGIVDGGSVDVKIPSGKLMLTKPFTVKADETLSFVFDINVVRKGNNGYNLLPVISKSGVAGTDVAVEEVDSDEATGTETPDESESETESGDESTDGATGNKSASGSGKKGQEQS